MIKSAHTHVEHDIIISKSKVPPETADDVFRWSSQVMLISRHVFCDKRDEEITFKRHTKITQQQPKSWKIIKSSQSQVKTASSQKSPPTQHDEDQPCFPSPSCRSIQFFSSRFITNFIDHIHKIFFKNEILGKVVHGWGMLEIKFRREWLSFDDIV